MNHKSSSEYTAWGRREPGRPRASILVVDDDPSVADLVRDSLAEDGVSVSVAKNAFQAQGMIKKGRPDLVILDRMLPDTDGLELCRELRASAETASMPILFLTSRTSVAEKIVALRLGGDDYLAKPFSLEELNARVEALLRRSLGSVEQETALEHGPLKMNIESRTVAFRGKPLDLTNKEFDLLRAFLEKPDRVLSRAYLLSHVWGYDIDLELTTKAVDMVVMGLRRKLGDWASRVEAVRGYGFRWKPHTDA